MGVEVVVVRLEGILHHSNEPPAFLQVPCHGQLLTASHTGAGQEVKGGHTAARRLAGPGGGCPEPPGRDSAREAIPSRGPTGVERRKVKDYRIKAPITPNIRTSALPINATDGKTSVPHRHHPEPGGGSPLRAAAAATSSAASLQRVHAG